MEGFVELESRGILVHEPEDDPVLLLSWRERGRVVPVWIGAAEAASLAARESGMSQNRPGPQEALVEMAEVCGDSILRAEIAGFHEGVFVTALVLEGGGRVDVRLSDAVAVCEIAGVPLYAALDVAEAASVPAGPLADDVGDDSGDGGDEEAVEEFARFLDEIDADDFLGNGGAAGSGGGADAGGSTGGGAGDPGESPSRGHESDTDVTDSDSSDRRGDENYPDGTPES